MTEKKMLSSFPELVSEWDYEKNRKLNISDFSYGSNKKIWWICKKEHSWEATIKSRTGKQKRGCPQCSGKIAESLDKTHPDLAKLWDYEKNVKSIDKYTAGMQKKVWWKCERGHSWESNIFYTVRRKNKEYCLECRSINNNRFVSKKEYPELFQEWDGLKNSENFESFTKGSTKKSWWLCPKGHSYLSDFPNRIRGRGCPQCIGRKTTKMKDDFPEIAKEWNDEKNIDTFTSGSTYLAQWKCANNHTYKEIIKNRTKHKKCPVCEERLPSPFYISDKDLLKEWDYEKNVFDPKSVSKNSHKKVWWKCDKGHSWQTPMYMYTRGSRCYKCWAGKQSSQGENELADYISNIVKIENNIIKHDKSIICPYELDIYLPDFNIAVEFNGTYWHSEKAGKDKYYHFNKWNLCRKQGIQLITIWEDDWRDNRDVIKSMISHKLNVSHDNKIYARKTHIDFVHNDIAKNFLNVHHIQGFKNGCSNIVLKSSDENIVALMQVSFKNNECSIERYATSLNVVGGFTKILKYVEKNNTEIEYISTFADHEVSDGGLYENNGFEIDSHLRPDYKYIYKNKRFHKFNFRKIRFEKDPDLLFEDGLTEKQLADLNEIPRVWDCGKTKYVKHINN